MHKNLLLQTTEGAKLVQVSFSDALVLAKKMGHYVDPAQTAQTAHDWLQSCVEPPIDDPIPNISKGLSHVDISLAAYVNDKLVAILPAYLNLEKGIVGNREGYSVTPYFSADPPSDVALSAITTWLQFYLNRKSGLIVKLFAEQSLLGALNSMSGIRIMDNTRLYGYYDLKIGTDEAWSCIRRSARSEINKGSCLTRKIYTKSSEISLSCLRHLLCRKTLGYTVNRHLLRNYIATMQDRDARIFEYQLDDKVVGVVCISRWTKFNLYGDYFYDIGAYAQVAPIPLHFCLYDAMKYYHEQDLGSRVYLLHGTPLMRAENELKLKNIDFFKRGLCTHTFIRTYKNIQLVKN